MGWTRAYSGSFQQLERQLLDDISELKGKEPLLPCHVLVGSNLLRLWVMDRLAEKEGWIQVRCMTFLDLAGAAASRCLAGEGRSPLPPGCESLLMSQALSRCRKKLKLLGEEEGEDRFVEGLVSTWRELREGGVRRWEILRRLGEKETELSILFAAFDQVCGEAAVYTRQDLLETAAEGEEPQPVGPLFVFGFYDLQPLQMKLLDAMAKNREVRLYLPRAEGPGERYMRRTQQWTRSRCDVNVLKAGAALDRSWKILSAPHRSGEVRGLLREVMDRVQTGGVPLERMAILLRETDPYRGLLRDALEGMAEEGFSLPHRFVPAPPLLETRQARSLLWLLDLVEGELSRSELIEFAQFAPLEIPEEDRNWISLWDSLTQNAGIGRGEEAWVGGLGHLRIALEEEADRREREGERQGHLPVERQALDSLIAWFDRLMGALDRIQGAEGRWDHLVDTVQEAASGLFTDNGTMDRSFWELRRLEGMEEVLGSASVSGFRRALRDTLQNVPQRQTTPVGEGLLIAQLMDARGLRFHTVLLPGLVQGAFPLRPAQDPFLLDGERQRLNRLLPEGERVAERFLRRNEEEVLFEMAANAAQEGIVLSYPRFEEGGTRPLLPSNFLIRWLREVGVEQVGYGDIEFAEGVDRLPASRPEPAEPERSLTPSEYDRSCLREEMAGTSKGAFAFLQERSSHFARAMDLVRERYGKPYLTRFDGDVGRVVQLGELLPGEAISPTRLESYAGCPFAYFLDTVLGVEAWEPDERELWPTPIERGLLVHEILERFWRKLREEKRELQSLSLESLNAFLNRLVSERVEEDETEGWSRKGGWKLSLPSLLDLLRGHLLWEREHLGAWRPSRFEIAFGAGGKAPVTLETSDGIVRFRGRIDRLDLGEEGSYRVVDYKTGRKRSNRCNVDTGECLQLPVYLLAASALLKSLPRLGVAGYLYVSRFQAGDCVELEGSNWEEIEDQMKGTVSTILRGIQGGLFPALPSKQCERTCVFKDACRGRDSALEKKGRDPRVVELLRRLGQEIED